MLIEFENSNHCRSNPTFRYQRTWWHYLAITLKNTSSAGQLWIVYSVYPSWRQLEHQTTPPRPASQLGWLARSSCEPEMATRSIEIQDRSKKYCWSNMDHHNSITRRKGWRWQLSTCVISQKSWLVKSRGWESAAAVFAPQCQQIFQSDQLPYLGSCDGAPP